MSSWQSQLVDERFALFWLDKAVKAYDSVRCSNRFNNTVTAAARAQIDAYKNFVKDNKELIAKGLVLANTDTQSTFTPNDKITILQTLEDISNRITFINTYRTQVEALVNQNAQIQGQLAAELIVNINQLCVTTARLFRQIILVARRQFNRPVQGATQDFITGLMWQGWSEQLGEPALTPQEALTLAQNLQERNSNVGTLQRPENERFKNDYLGPICSRLYMNILALEEEEAGRSSFGRKKKSTKNVKKKNNYRK